MHIPYTNIMKNKISSSEPNLSNIELSIPCNYALLHVHSAMLYLGMRLHTVEKILLCLKRGGQG